jgi:CDP-diacylglycerol--glycerol-3-phosphate 3-phosphatidyltransferase
MPMNLPNQLTLLRICLIPVFVILYVNGMRWGLTGRYAALFVFVAASATDALDGYIARKYHLITNFGKLMDPLADKLLVCAALVAMVGRNELPSWAVILIISREFVITGFRMLALEQKIVIAASGLAKIKTITQMIMIIMILTWVFPDFIVNIMIWLTAFLSVASAVEYIVKNKKILTERPKAKRQNGTNSGGDPY